MRIPSLLGFKVAGGYPDVKGYDGDLQRRTFFRVPLPARVRRSHESLQIVAEVAVLSRCLVHRAVTASIPTSAQRLLVVPT
jgi:hypothetical protein